ncbi:hypothetical protein MLD38_025393 [Melastoma candidum]|uniref:Uncharacterized protein n=1 Tax=Melastoma candidum TaxID=119954 RepID=A0ACB9NVB9_9MYRT|nr:hypothetical protein MLD38_025393 [Melastoma candidum]
MSKKPVHHLGFLSSPPPQSSVSSTARPNPTGAGSTKLLLTTRRSSSTGSRSWRRGLITRSVKEAVDLFHRRFGLEQMCNSGAGSGL